MQTRTPVSRVSIESFHQYNLSSRVTLHQSKLLFHCEMLPKNATSALTPQKLTRATTFALLRLWLKISKRFKTTLSKRQKLDFTNLADSKQSQIGKCLATFLLGGNSKMKFVLTAIFKNVSGKLEPYIGLISQELNTRLARTMPGIDTAQSACACKKAFSNGFD